MGKIVKPNQPCDVCPSSDGKQIYEDGGAFCFVCKTNFPPSGTKKIKKVKKITERTHESITKELNEILELPCRGFKERGIYKPVAEHYNLRVSYDMDGKINNIYHPLYFVKNEELAGFKVRALPKKFWFKGYELEDDDSLIPFGLNNYGSGKRLVITEGEFDAMAVQSAYYKKYKTFYPVISLRSSTSTDDLIPVRDKLRMFDEVVVWMDNDKAGKDAEREVCRIVGFDKVKIVKCNEKDANDLWLKEPDAVLKAIWDATTFTPAGILTKDELWKQLEEYNKIESVPYPSFMGGLNSKLKGMRFGEITLWTSGTGSGKSTLLREIAFNLLAETSDKLGIVSLEESPAETSRMMAGMALNKNPAEEELTNEELKKGFDIVFGENRVLVLDHQGSISDGSIMDYLEYMCLSGAKYIFVDHITILASEGTEGLSGNEAIDKIMNDLLRLVKKYNVWVGLISHLRKTDNKGKSFEEGKLPSLDDIKGSGSIKQISMDIIAFARNVGHENEMVRNTIKTKVLKCRYTGLTGPSGSLYYQYNTGRLTEGMDIPEDDEKEQFRRI